VVVNGVFGIPDIQPQQATKKADEIIRWLIEADVIDANGKINKDFDRTKDLIVEIPSEFARMKDEILNTCAELQTKNHFPPAKVFVTNRRRDDQFLTAEFKSLWDSICARTRYSVEFNSDEVSQAAIKYLDDPKTSPTIPKRKVVVEMGEQRLTQRAVEAEQGGAVRALTVEAVPRQLTDIVAWLVEHTRLTRKSIVQILKGIRKDKLDQIFNNEVVFLEQVRSAIETVIADVCTTGVKYWKRQPGDNEKFLVEDLFGGDEEVDLSRSVPISKGLYEYVVWDSEIERDFALALDKDKRVRLIVKLPERYLIETPAGGYNPDWAIVMDDGGVVYLVRETKGSDDLSALRFPTERMKILYGAQHFEAIGADYDWLVNAGQLRPGSRKLRHP
jgi:type III restriction enzyme